MPSQSSAISGKKIKHSLREYIWESPILRGIFSNPFIVSILILTVIWLLDILYGKNFSCVSTREIVQHVSTTYIVVSLGIVLNNLTIKNKYKKDLTTDVNGGTTLTDVYPQVDQLISEYTE